MECPSCGSAIRDQAKFCSNCGHELGLLCPDCGHENPLEANFCEGCGTAIGAQATDRGVEVGQRVKAGHMVVVLEAMKMENTLPAPADGVVTRLCTGPGASCPSNPCQRIFSESFW